MSNQALALARAAAQRVLGRSLRPGARGLAPYVDAAEPAGILRIEAAQAPVTQVPLMPRQGPVMADPRAAPAWPERAGDIKPGARLGGLRPEMTRIYGDVAETWSNAGAPRPVITSGNDSRHMRGSRHYDDEAFDLRGNNIDAATARRIRDDLAGRLGGDYQVIYETFPDAPANNHIHVEYDPPDRR